jgi:HPt (histidine-containing phosphotransfer) domain-containing protein
MNTGSEPFNLAKLKELYGDDTVKELIEMSLDEARGLIADLDKGISERNSKVVAAAAHQLKGLALTMTIHSLNTISLAIEGEAHREDWERVAGKQVELKQAFNEFEQYVGSITL